MSKAKSKKELLAELEALKAKRKPIVAKTDAELAEEAECAKIMAELEAEQRALRAEENDAIRAQYAPTKARAFFDFDPEMAHPATIEYAGHICTLHTRFVVRHANADDMRVYDDIKDDSVQAKGNPGAIAELGKKAESLTARLGRQCMVYPMQVKGDGSAQFDLDIEASLRYFGGAAMALGNAAATLGGLHAMMHQAKS